MFERNEVRQSKVFEALSTLSLFLFFVFVVAVLSAVLSSTAKAQSAALASDPATLATSADASNRSFVFSGQVIAETARSADEAQPTAFSGWYVLTANATHKKTALTGSLRAGYTREYSYRRDDDTDGAFDNPILSVSKSYLNGRDFDLDWLDSISVSVSGSVGANKESARRKFLWSTGLAVTGAKSFGRFNLRQTFGHVHGFYEYDIRDDGTVNSPDFVRGMTSLYYEINSRLSIGGSITYKVSNSFQGVKRAEQLSQATIDYALTDKMAASIGVGNERFTLEANGQSETLRFNTPESAQYFVDLIFII